MSGYVRATKFATTFEGESVTCLLSPLSLPDLLRMESTTIDGDKDEQAREATKLLAEIAPNYVSEWNGPKDAEGNVVPVDEVCRSAYFLEVAVALGGKLLSASRPPMKPSEGSASLSKASRSRKSGAQNSLG